MSNDATPHSSGPRITDPQRLRALAHPLRNELLDVLRIEGEATATQCAERTGESVASCSFHLRMLAKYGFVEPGEPKGREKPWRLAVRSFTATADFEDPASKFALREVSSLVVEREMQRLRDWIARTDEEPREWVEASTIATSTFWATAEEMSEISRTLGELTDRFTDRFDDPAKRPEGARIVRLLGVTTVDPDRSSDARTDGADS
ncbi:helix-turn-helix transcriptional regulator [Phytoactinopolyspora alkaliphila]|uniref:Helix-turn-helix transcriptional regulator n=1 Tax=Phytoactinopolyspora alkaliphila TaxID=1783498 RepID=A0A6N9YPR8_9ACTN|nr:helix-turn-helix domain-containing protein [Phytoactinopolyspora alkaliphila]NED96972.1 helix-turn-helix transcriptional regulator [Phytoactinopolyspora alkaliphila]